MSESSKARRASLKNLNVEDKKRVANLIKELAKTGEERELALERLQEERVSFDEQLGSVQEEQTALKQEREALKQRLEKSEKLLKKYESELKDVKTEKEEQEKILKKKFQAQPQSTQTSPLIQNFSTDGTTKSGRFNSEQDDIQPRGTKKTRSAQAYIGDSESNDRDGRKRWSTPQVPVYSNSLFDVKVSNVEHEQNSETRSVSEEYQRSSVVESGGLHELYLREYSLQLRLQEQQIEIQRQQVQLQQQLQLLQQQQQQGRQQQGQQQQQQQQQPELAKQQQRYQEQNNQQQGLTQQREKHNEQHSYQENQEQHVHNQHEPLEYKQKHSNADHKHQHKKQEWRNQSNQQTLHSHQLQPLDQQEPQYPSEQKNEDIFTQSSPTQQTNLLQKRTPERKGHKIEPKHRADTNIPHEHASHSPRQRHGHDHHQRVVENLRHGHEHEDVFDGRNGEPQTKDRSYTPSGSPSHRHYHHSGHDVEKTRFAEEHQTNRNKGQYGTDSTSFEQRHVSKRKSPRKHDRANYAKQIDLNNNEYFQPKSHSQQKNRYDINDNLVYDHYPQEYLSESYSETDEEVEKDHYSSERPCHCGYYHNHTRQQHATLEYDQPIPNHSHSKGIPQHGLKKKSPHGIIENPHQKVEPLPAQVYQQPIRHQHSPDRTNSYHQRLLHDPKHTRVSENRRPLSHHHLHKGEYRHRADIREEHHDAPHYVTHKHEGESEYEAAFYQPSQEIGNKHQPTERRTYTRHQSRSPTGALLSPQVGKTEHDYLPSDGLQYSRSQMNQDISKYLLDDYIYNHRPAGQDNAKLNAGYEPRDTSNKHSTKRKISRKSHGNTEIEGEENGHLALPYMTSQQIQYEGKYITLLTCCKGF